MYKEITNPYFLVVLSFNETVKLVALPSLFLLFPEETSLSDMTPEPFKSVMEMSILEILFGCSSLFLAALARTSDLNDNIMLARFLPIYRLT